MDVKACDRCGKIYPFNKTVDIYDYTIINNRQCEVLDLCDKCAKELESFIHCGRPTTAVERG